VNATAGEVSVDFCVSRVLHGQCNGWATTISSQYLLNYPYKAERTPFHTHYFSQIVNSTGIQTQNL
jgi:hypothetical protein